ncbi:DUF485 domain-containing protein [Rhodococcus phenolicus]|uniref:DUF485 domain-containing protein n=1 Tax=Rhodococcus phenolicus TaxID=263849 RepID=UPI00082B5546|nr:DUF485 domain-containing protein [Rhodococcus phenolicus]
MTGTVAPNPTWARMLELPEVAELRRRRRTVTTALGTITIVLFASFLVGFIAFPELLGSTSLLGVPLSLWLVFSQFAGTWVLVWAYFRLSRTYIEPAADAAIRAVSDHRGELS